MKKPTKTILLALTVLVMLSPALQQATKLVPCKPLSGVTVTQERPVLAFDSLVKGAYQRDEEQYLKQTAGFREPLTRLYNQCLWTLFRYAKVAEDQRIVITRDNWIFEPQTVEEYYQSRSYQLAKDSAEMAQRLEREAHRLRQIQELLEPYGTRFFVALLPGKEQICAEHMPENTLYFKEKKLTAYGFYSKRMKELGVNHIDLAEWFMQMKDSVSWPLFPQTGTHWSNLGAIHAADTLVRYMEWLSDSNMVNIQIGETFQRTLKPDADLESLMNLIWPLQKTPNMLAKAYADGDTTAWRPRLLTIGDSFYWNIIKFTPIQEIYSETPYWYYFSTAFYNGKGTNVAEKDVLKEVLKSDFVMLFYSTATLYGMSNYFSDKILRSIYYNEGETGPIDFDSIPERRSSKFLEYTQKTTEQLNN